MRVTRSGVKVNGMTFSWIKSKWNDYFDNEYVLHCDDTTQGPNPWEVLRNQFDTNEQYLECRNALIYTKPAPHTIHNDQIYSQVHNEIVQQEYLQALFEEVYNSDVDGYYVLTQARQVLEHVDSDCPPIIQSTLDDGYQVYFHSYGNGQSYDAYFNNVNGHYLFTRIVTNLQ